MFYNFLGLNPVNMRGENDATVPTPSQKALIAAFTHAHSVKSMVIDGANHNFSSIFGKNKAKAYELYVGALVNYFTR